MSDEVLSAARAPGTPVSADSVVTQERGGSIYMSPTLPLAAEYPSIPAMFDETADRWPDRPFLLERPVEGEGWRSVTYGEAQRQSRAIAQWLLNEGIGAGDVLAILSRPTIEHGVLMIGAQRVRVPTAPVNPAYSLLASDPAKVIGCIERTNARIAFVDDADAFQSAMVALAPLGVRFIIGRGSDHGLPCVRYDDIIATEPTARVDAETAKIRPDTVVRVMHTSGSTGTPKAAPLTSANMTLTVAQCEAVNLILHCEDQVQFIESMPFNHIMGGNYNFNNMIRMGAALHLDEGKPTPALFQKTLANLREVSPHIFHTVPAGYVMLCAELEHDADLQRRFFRNLVYMGSGGAALPADVLARMQAMAVANTGKEIPIFGFYGATEYSLGTVRYWPGPMEIIGLPLPGIDVKLTQEGDKLGMRIRSAALMPRSGYLGNQEASDALFDDEGYFITGDAMRFHDPAQPHLGLVFDGRLSDDFKMQTGTWVSVGVLREDLLAAGAGLFQDAVICGINEGHVSALIWGHEQRARRLLGAGADEQSYAQVMRDPLVREAVRSALEKFNETNPAAARFVATADLMSDPLDAPSGELTDKGSVNQRKVRERRLSDVTRLYDPSSDIFRFSSAPDAGDKSL